MSEEEVDVQALLASINANFEAEVSYTLTIFNSIFYF